MMINELADLRHADRHLFGAYSPVPSGELRDALSGVLSAAHAGHRYIPETEESVAMCTCGDEWMCPQLKAAHRLAVAILGRSEEERVRSGNGWIV